MTVECNANLAEEESSMVTNSVGITKTYTISPG